MKILQEIRVPQESVNDQTLMVLELFFQENDVVKKGDIVAELETSKTTLTVEVLEEGYIKYFCKIGDELTINSLIAQIADRAHSKGNNDNNSNIQVAILVEENNQSDAIFDTVFSKQALELMAENSLGKELFKNRDFVSTGDINLLLRPQSTIKETKESSERLNQTEVALSANVSLEKISSNKRREIEYLSHVQSASLVSVINTLVDLKGVDTFLRDHLKYFKETILPIVMYECGRLLLKYRALNAYFVQDNVAYYKDVNIGFAIDIDKGLKVVVVRNTQDKSIHEIENEAFRLANLYQDNALDVKSLSDVTFTITDLSSEGVFSFHPLINKNNGAILGISSMDKGSGKAMLSLAFDHRITEGKIAAMFLSELRDRIQSYRSSDTGSIDTRAIKCSKCFKKLSDEISEVGFVEYLNTKGEKGYICQSCFKGF
jgi:pyruvate/2-oxoglutarate dehydrogenase complex dihydrolipoamide acyltransferase (E2) component